MQAWMKSGRSGVVGRLVILAAAVGCLAAVSGCDGLVDMANIASWGGLVDPWYTSSMGLPAFPTLYDPTSTIQSVIGYRSSAMENAANGWCEYISQ